MFRYAKVILLTLICIWLVACSSSSLKEDKDATPENVKSSIEEAMGMELTGIEFKENVDIKHNVPSYKEEEEFLFAPYYDENSVPIDKKVVFYDILIDTNEKIDSLSDDEKFYLLDSSTLPLQIMTWEIDQNLKINDACINLEAICKIGNISVHSNDIQYEMKVTPYKDYLNVMYINEERYKPEKEENLYAKKLLEKKLREVEELEEEKDMKSSSNTYVNSSSSSSSSTSTTDSYMTTPSTIWNDYSYSMKQSTVSTSLNRLTSEGYTITADVDYFIQALDSFYVGNPMETTSYYEAVTMIGLMSETIQ